MLSSLYAFLIKPRDISATLIPFTKNLYKYLLEATHVCGSSVEKAFARFSPVVSAH
jgi:hypothetical protein